MMLQFLIAWRNLWRNSRRTAVILVAIIAGIWMMLFMGALMRGMVQSMLDNALANLTGHVQVHHPRFSDDPAIENRIDDTQQLRQVLAEALPAGSRVAWRVRLEVVASNARHSAGLVLIGSDLPGEVGMTFLKDAGIEGSLPDGDGVHGILAGRRLLENFATRVGHKLILTARDSSGEIASAAFPITGAFDTFLDSSETGFAFVSSAAAQQFLKLGSAVTEVSILLPDIGGTAAVTAALRARLDPARFAVTPWQDNVPLVTAYIRIWDTFSYVWGLVIFAAMGLGLANTLLMAVYERIREFGLVRALGCRPGRIVAGVLVESVLMLLLGLAAGNALAFAFIGWLGARGINLAGFSGTTEMLGLPRVIHPEILPADLVTFNAMVFLLGVLVSLYPAIKAARFTPVEAMTHNG